MIDRFYRLKARLKGFVFLPSGGTMENKQPCWIPGKRTVRPYGPADLTSVRYGNRSCKVQLEELKRCGTSIALAAT
jgi:hypothetical protein